jgi:tetratricopeptide (TPR) repeat protein
VELFRALAERQPYNPDVHYYYGITLSFAGDLTGALREYDTAIRLDPGFTRPYYAAYYALGQAGQTEQAIEYLRRLVRAKPEEVQARQMLELLEPRSERVPPVPAPPPGRP